MTTVGRFAAGVAILAGIIGLSGFIHEWGHVRAARAQGLVVEKFMIFAGKPIARWERHGTRYQIGWIPLLCGVTITGGPYNSTDPDPKTGRVPPFSALPWTGKAKFLLAGVTTNVLAAWAALAVTFAWGAPSWLSTTADRLSLAGPLTHWWGPLAAATALTVAGVLLFAAAVPYVIVTRLWGLLLLVLAPVTPLTVNADALIPRQGPEDPNIAGQAVAATADPGQVLAVLAVVNIALAGLNLSPVFPVLDGGRLAVATWTSFRGGGLSRAWEEGVAVVGGAALVFLLVVLDLAYVAIGIGNWAF
jgi:membrane-associated protease RseP (regulator of RpoE activity)